MKPLVIIGGKKARFKPKQHQTTVHFYFPKPSAEEGEKGEIDLINGDVPRMIIKANRQIEIDIEQK
jgi:hypothetical protein